MMFERLTRDEMYNVLSMVEDLEVALEMQASPRWTGWSPAELVKLASRIGIPVNFHIRQCVAHDPL